MKTVKPIYKCKCCGAINVELGLKPIQVEAQNLDLETDYHIFIVVSKNDVFLEPKRPGLMTKDYSAVIYKPCSKCKSRFPEIVISAQELVGFTCD